MFIGIEGAKGYFKHAGKYLLNGKGWFLKGKRGMSKLECLKEAIADTKDVEILTYKIEENRVIVTNWGWELHLHENGWYISDTSGG